MSLLGWFFGYEEINAEPTTATDNGYDNTIPSGVYFKGPNTDVNHTHTIDAKVAQSLVVEKASTSTSTSKSTCDTSIYNVPLLLKYLSSVISSKTPHLFRRCFSHIVVVGEDPNQNDAIRDAFLHTFPSRNITVRIDDYQMILDHSFLDYDGGFVNYLTHIYCNYVRYGITARPDQVDYHLNAVVYMFVPSMLGAPIEFQYIDMVKEQAISHKFIIPPECKSA